jgi:hypothetical protein
MTYDGFVGSGQNAHHQKADTILLACELLSWQMFHLLFVTLPGKEVNSATNCCCLKYMHLNRGYYRPVTASTPSLKLFL